MDTAKKSEDQDEIHFNLKTALLSWLLSILLLVGLIYFVVKNFGDTKVFSAMLRESHPEWLVIAIMLQIGTYICAGSLWNVVIKAGVNKRVPLRELAVLAVESLSVNQIVPFVGMGGNFVVIRAMKRLGLPYALAVEAILIEILSQFTAFAILTPCALLVLFFNHNIQPAILWVVASFTIMMIVVSLAVFWLLEHQDWKPPAWLSKFAIIRRTFDVLTQVSSERVKSGRILLKTSALDATIFFLDAATLWAVMQAIGMPIGFFTAFSAAVIAMLTGTLILLPGGVGGYEAACVIVLTLLGVPVSAALIGTLQLRVLTLWLPLIPGLVVSQREIHWRAKT